MSTEKQDKDWEEVDFYVKGQAVLHLKKYLDEEVKEQIRAEMKDDPENWWIKYHYGWGMWVRNFLRLESEANLPDYLWPSGNIDDYYVKVVEEAVSR